MTPRRIVIAGGGITGLTTAYRPLRAARDAAGAPFSVTVLEARARLGGSILTERPGGAVLDGGPDALDPELSTLLRAIPYVSTATIAMGYARADVEHPLDASGLLCAGRSARSGNALGRSPG